MLGADRAGRRPDIYRMLLDRQIDAVTFTSASTVRNFAKIFGEEQAADLLRTTVVASIGPVTAEAAQQLGIKTTVMPERYTIRISSTRSSSTSEPAVELARVTARFTSTRRAHQPLTGSARTVPAGFAAPPAIRALVRETRLTPDNFIYPLFVVPGQGQRRESASMPGVFQLSVDEIVKEARGREGRRRARRAAVRAAGEQGRRRDRAPPTRRGPSSRPCAR